MTLSNASHVRVVVRYVAAPFRLCSFRFQFPADAATSWGIETENLVLGWHSLVATGSVLALTLYWALQYLGSCSRRCSACSTASDSAASSA